MELGVRLTESNRIIENRLLFGDESPKPASTRLSIAAGSHETNSRRLENGASFEDIGQGNIPGLQHESCGTRRQTLIGSMDDHSTLHATNDRDESFRFENAERLTQRRPGNAESFNEIRFVAQRIALVELSQNDEAPELVGDLLRLLAGLGCRTARWAGARVLRHCQAFLNGVSQEAFTVRKSHMSRTDSTVFPMGTPRRTGLVRFNGPDEARLLHETTMMSMPTMDPPAGEELMEWATASGQVVKVLFGDPETEGMSLVWSWFAPNFPLPRHSHSADCLYYVAKGELHMGRQVVSEGEGFFVPDGASYAYTAGPDGVEVLEFRAVSSFDMRITESLPRWAKMVEISREHRTQWTEELPAHL
jgi:hypothetical protein